ncbi:MAG: DNA polymerase III subunit beta [Candidatus Vogelbacteria bacterium]|nr:DNA polymerase III subunit beta [Candidatus Vogelbacteria bacterium]
MKAECTKDKLKYAIINLERVAVKNSSLPILQSILIEAKDNNLVLKATNLDVGLEIKIPAKVQRHGSVAIPGGVLGSFLSGLSGDETIRLDMINNNLSISTRMNSTVIKNYPAEDFPIIPKIEGENRFSIPAEKLVYGIKSTSYSASSSDMKPEISSVYLYNDGGGLFFVATDSFRLSEKSFDIKNFGENSVSLILPYKNAIEISRAFEGSTDVLDVYFNKNQIFIVSPSIYFTSRVVGGIFPDYKQIIPKEKKSEVIVLKRDLVDSIKISNIFSDKFNQISLKIVPSDKLFEINSKNQDKGESSTRLEGTVEGEDLNININARYLLECVPYLEGDSVYFIFNGSNKPVIIRGVGDKSFLYLVMPMNN